MPSDRRQKINYILYFITLVAIFLIAGYYSDLVTLFWISLFFPIVFIPIILLFAFEKHFIRSKEGLSILAVSFSLIFYILIVSLRYPDTLKSQNIGIVYILILVASFFMYGVINLFSYKIIRFFGIRTGIKINENLRTISFPIIKNNIELTINMVRFFLEEIVSFEYQEKIENNIYKFQRNETDYLLLKYSEIPNQSNLLISFIMFYDDQDGVEPFKSDKIDSFSIILGKLLGGDIIATPADSEEYFNSYFLRYKPIIKRVNEYFGKNKINLYDIKYSMIFLVSLVGIMYVAFNYEKISQYIFSIDSDMLIRIMAITVGIPASLYYTGKILGLIK